MRRIILTQNDKTLTLFVADNAFASIVPAYPAETEIAILQMLADKMIERIDISKTILLAELQLPDISKAHDFRAVYIDANDPEKKVQQRMVEDLQITNETLYLLKIPVDDLGKNPPIDLKDSLFITSPAGIQLFNQFKNLARGNEDLAILLSIEESEEPAPAGEEKRYELTERKLRNIADTIIGTLPENPSQNLRDALTFLDNRIAAAATTINKAKQLPQNLVKDFVAGEYEYFKIIDTLTVQIYNAAKRYYIEIWQQNQNNFAELIKKREEFNRLFAGIVRINADYTLSNIKDSIDMMHKRSLEDNEKLISQLMDQAYKTAPKTASTYLLGNLQNSDDFKPVSKINTYGFEFTDTARTAYQKHQRAKDLIEHAQTSPTMARSIGDIADSIEDIRQRAITLKKNHEREIGKNEELANNVGDQGSSSFWQRNKGTIISIGLGVLIGAAAAAAFVLFAPITLPLLAMIGIAAVGALAVVGISAIIGRVIDKRRNAQVKQEIDAPGSAQERESLLGEEHSPSLTTTSLSKQLNGNGHSKNDALKKSDSIVDFSAGAVERVSSSPTLFQRQQSNPDLLSDAAIEAKSGFEVAFSHKVAGLLDPSMGDIYYKVSSTFSDSGYDINKFIAYINEDYPASAKGVIKTAIRSVAQEYSDINPDLFNDNALSNPAYELKQAINAAGKTDKSEQQQVKRK